MISSVTVFRSAMNQNEVGTWHHHSRTMPASLFSRNSQSAKARSSNNTGSGIGFTSPPQANSLMLRGPFSGQFMTFMVSSRSMSDRRCALFADLRIVDEAIEIERLDEIVRAVIGDGMRHRHAADRRCLEAPGAPAAVDVVVLDRRQAHDR